MRLLVTASSLTIIVEDRFLQRNFHTLAKCNIDDNTILTEYTPVDPEKTPYDIQLVHHHDVLELVEIRPRHYMIPQIQVHIDSSDLSIFFQYDMMFSETELDRFEHYFSLAKSFIQNDLRKFLQSHLKGEPHV